MQRPAVLLFDLGGVLVENVGFERRGAQLSYAVYGHPNAVLKKLDS